MADSLSKFIGRFALALFLIELVGFLLIFFIGQNVNLPSLTYLTSVENTMQSQIYNIENSLSFQPLTAIPQSSIPIISEVVAITDFIVGSINFLAGIGSLVLNVFLFVGTGIILISFVLFVFLPSLIGALNLGVFGLIFGAGYAVVLLILAVYAYEYIYPILIDTLKTLRTLVP